MLTIGIDDAGKGPVIGPMIIGGVLINEEQEQRLKKDGIKDSKLILHESRIKLSKLIKENSIASKTIIIEPSEIDSAVESKDNLNTLEARKMAEAINHLNTSNLHDKQIKVIVDCPSVNTKSWRSKLMSFIKNKDNLTIICEHKADFNYVSVGAASILAKVIREEEVAKLKKQFINYGDLGSGYPADPITKDFLKKHGKALEKSGIFRKSWRTWKNLYGESKDKKMQSTIADF